MHQLKARFPSWGVEARDDETLTLSFRDEVRYISLARLYADLDEEGINPAERISRWVREMEGVMRPSFEFSAEDLLWCVRSDRYLDDVARDSLITLPLAGDLVAFCAASLPGSVMRGVATYHLDERGMSEEDARTHATNGTLRRMQGTLDKIAAAARQPRDGWRLQGDILFQGSLLALKEGRDALRGLCQGDILVGVPDRGTLLCIAPSAPGEAGFSDRVRRAYRESFDPCSRFIYRLEEEHIVVEDEGRVAGKSGLRKLVGQR